MYFVFINIDNVKILGCDNVLIILFLDGEWR